MEFTLSDTVLDNFIKFQSPHLKYFSYEIQRITKPV